MKGRFGGRRRLCRVEWGKRQNHQGHRGKTTEAKHGGNGRLPWLDRQAAIAGEGGLNLALAAGAKMKIAGEIRVV